jgi:chromosome segregation ATPase
MAAEDGFTWTLNGRRQSLTAQALRAAAADQRIAELEYELERAREQLIHQQNRASSLETSLALKSEENSSLSDRITELSADLQIRHDQFESARLALASVESERISLDKSFALKSDENSRLSHRVTQLSADLQIKHDQLERARLALAVAEAERAPLEKSLALKSDENSKLSHRTTELSADLQIKHDQLERARLALAAAEAERIKASDQGQADISSRDHQLTLVSARAESAEKRFEQVQQRLHESDSEIECLRRAQAESVAELARRATALAGAEHTITSLGTLFWQLESAVRRQEHEHQESDATTPSVVAERSSIGSVTCGILERDLGRDAWLFESLRNSRA